MIKDTFYFSHDSNARNDIKIMKLRRSLGLEGYAIYFCLIEILRDQKEFKLPLDSVSDIAFELHTSEDKVKAVIVGFGLFEIDDDDFFSNRLLRSMVSYVEKKQKLSDAGKRGNQKRWLEHNKTKFLSGGDSGGDHNPIALKESKEKESKENTINSMSGDLESRDKSRPDKYSFEDKVNFFIILFNETKGTPAAPKKYKANDKVKRALKLRLKEGYSSKDFRQAITNCKNSEHHIKNPHLLTPEFILRVDKLEMYINKETPTDVDVKLSNSEKRRIEQTQINFL